MNNFNGQLGQDIFVANYFDFLKDGQFLEIGAGHPLKQNNTIFLEKELNWRGVSVENNPTVKGYWKNFRSNELISKDAYEIDYKELLDDNYDNEIIHYLSLDLDEEIRGCVDILPMLPFDEYEFLVITIETDFYDNKNEGNKQKQRDFLSKDYELVFPDVVLALHGEIEDWWIKKNIFEEKPIKKFDKSAYLHYQDGLRKWGFLEGINEYI